MVVRDADEQRIDRVFHALADRTRRDIVRHALSGQHTVSSLATRYDMSFAAVQKHVAVLAEVGLVTKERRGREQLVRTDIAAVRDARQLLDELEVLWRSRIDRLEEVLGDARETDRPEAQSQHDPG